MSKNRKDFTDCLIYFSTDIYEKNVVELKMNL